MNDKTIALTILSQIGGNRFCNMIGVKQNSVIPNGLRCKFKAKARNKATGVDILLNGKDLYDMKFFRIWGANKTAIAEFNDLYAEDLEETFSAATGLATRLF